MLIKCKTLDKQGIKSILLIQLGDIGDVILSFPTIKTLRKYFPNALLIVAVREKAKSLVEDCPYVSGVIGIDEIKRSFAKEIKYQTNFFINLRSFRFDLAIDLRTGTRGAILALLSGAKQRIGRFADDGKLWRNRVFTHLTLPPVNHAQHVSEYYSDIIASYDLLPDFPYAEIIVPEYRIKEAICKLHEFDIPTDKPIVAIQPFSLWEYKEWSFDKFTTLIARIIESYSVSVILIGAPNEQTKAAKLIEQCYERIENAPQKVFDLVGKTPIELLPALFKMCKLFIGVDSAGQHIAGGVNIPSVIIYGPTPHIPWAPRGDRHHVIKKDWPCVPCRSLGCNGSHQSRCLDELEDQEVISYILGGFLLV